MNDVTLQVTGMSCAHCENAIREELEQLPALRIDELSAATGRLVVASDSPVDVDRVIAAVDEAGYTAVAVGS